MRTLENAKNLRSSQTEAEQRLWYHLRAHRFMGLKFKRQKPLSRYIVDFVCVEHRLIIELDGGQHADEMSYDQQRDAWLRGQGYKVLRFWNNDVMQQLEGGVEQIRLALSPAPLPLAGEGRKKLSSPACVESVANNFPSPTCGTAEGSLRSSGVPTGVPHAGEGAGGEGAPK